MAPADVPLVLTKESLLAQVSSLYGPGNITCWYLTILSVVISWTVHPHKACSDSIDADLVAALTLPAVAAAHLIQLVHRFLADEAFHTAVVAIAKITASSISWKDSAAIPPLPSIDVSANGTASITLAQATAAIEAPLVVVEAFMLFGGVLFLACVTKTAAYRTIAINAVGILCFAADCYLHLSRFATLGLRYTHPPADANPRVRALFHRYFIAEFDILFKVTALLGSVFVFSGTVALLDILRSLRPPLQQQVVYAGSNELGHIGPHGQLHSRAPDMQRERHGRPESASQGEPEPEPVIVAERQERSFRIFAMVSVILVPLSMLSYASPVIWHSENALKRLRLEGLGSALKVFMAQFVRDFYPRTTCSIKDLDQAMAAIAGATILLFSVLGALSSQYKILKGRRTQSTGNRGPSRARHISWIQ